MNTEQMREAFEAEMRCEETWGHQSLKRKKCGRYENWRVDLMWSVWQAALTHPQEPARVGGVPEGWQVVPVEPTPQMKTAGIKVKVFADYPNAGPLNWAEVKAIYSAMLTAAPQAPAHSAAASFQAVCSYISDVLSGDASSGEKHIARTIMHLLPLADAVAATQAPADVGEGDDFLLGVCVALQVVTAMDCNVTWREIVNTAGVEDLIRFATVIEPEEWELAGFSRYAKQELMRDKPDTAMSTKAGGV